MKRWTDKKEKKNHCLFVNWNHKIKQATTTKPTLYTLIIKNWKEKKKWRDLKKKKKRKREKKEKRERRKEERRRKKKSSQEMLMIAWSNAGGQNPLPW